MNVEARKHLILQACGTQFQLMAQILEQRNKEFEEKMKLMRARFLRNFKRKLNRNLQIQLNAWNSITLGYINNIPLKRKRRFFSKNRSRHWWIKIFNNDMYDEMLENFRMDKLTFIYICDKLRAELTPKPSNFRHSLSVELKVAVSIYKLASCAEYRVVGNQFGFHKSTVHQVLYQFCRAMLKVFLKEEVQLPDEEEINKLMNEFEAKSNIPNIWGAIDGSHIPVTPTADGYRDYINRKGWPSLVLQAVVDSNYLFRDITCKHPGSNHDATVFKDSGFYERMKTKKMPTKLVEGTQIPACIVGDPAYPLLPWLLKGYTGNVTAEQESFNIYMNRARVVVENAFGRLKGRFRILQKRMDIDVKFVPNVVAVCCILHNILERKKVPYLISWNKPTSDDGLLTPPGIIAPQFSNTLPGEELREFLKCYVVKNFELLRSHIKNN